MLKCLFEHNVKQVYADQTCLYPFLLGVYMSRLILHYTI